MLHLLVHFGIFGISFRDSGYVFCSKKRWPWFVTVWFRSDSFNDSCCFKAEQRRLKWRSLEYHQGYSSVLPCATGFKIKETGPNLSNHGKGRSSEKKMEGWHVSEMMLKKSNRLGGTDADFLQFNVRPLQHLYHDLHLWPQVGKAGDEKPLETWNKIFCM